MMWVARRLKPVRSTLHKPVVIGEILPSGQMQTVWKSSGLVEPKPWSPYLPKK